MLIEYEVAYRGSRVKISQRICPCPGTNGHVDADSEGTVWRSLGASYFEAPAGSGLESGYPGGSGFESSSTGGSGFESSSTGGSGFEDSAPGGEAAGPKPVVIFGPIVTWE